MSRHLSFMLEKLLREEQQRRDDWRLIQLDEVIPANEKQIEFNKKHGMPYLALHYEIEALKREYKMLRRRRYQ